ncbi:MAG: glycosyltransferase family 4 protein [Candidatus Omnitrophica bacterium]|nr:glycosyltransferase family 4 protein [Candidatus Omnitrophota bacterium]
MRIGFDARMITYAGIGRYIKDLLSEIIYQAKEDTFVLFGKKEELKEFSSDNVEIINWRAPIYSIREQIVQPYDKYDLDLLHVPHFNIPLFCKTKIIVTIHDLIYLLFPKAASSPLARHYAKFMITQSIKKAAHVIAVSKNTKDDLISLFGDEYGESIAVVYEGASSEFKIMDDEQGSKRVKEKYNLADKMILYVGSIKPHKNVGTLIKAYMELKKRGIPHQLVITGRWDRKEDGLRKFIDGKDIKYIGEIPSQDLEILYNSAELLLHLSLYEGFGLTVLEAMQCGTPVVTSGSSSLPEVGGDAVKNVDPLDVGQIADTVYNILYNNDIKYGMIERGLKQSRRFSWNITAKKTLEVYRNIKI